MNALQLYTCTANLTGVAREETSFFIRCKDQPSAPENERNENHQSYEFRLRGSNALKIKELKPDQTIYAGTTPAPVTLSVETLFGCDSGEALCYYSTTDVDENYIQMFDTGGVVHTQRQDLVEGTYTYFIKCIDSGGNVAVNSTTFEINIDASAPDIARVYQDGGMLKIITIKESECAYSFEDCDFTFQEGTEMPYANTTKHVADWNTEETYFIKCRDEFQNEPADCSIIVRPQDNFL